MRKARCLLLTSGLAVGFAACDGLPDVQPPNFACVDDQPLDDGSLPCGPGHHCVDGACVSRLDCQDPEASLPGCKRVVVSGVVRQVERCEPIRTELLSALQCVGGTFETTEGVVTSTRPANFQACDCEAGYQCVTWLEGPGLDLRWLPEGGDPPGPERMEARYCAAACSQEANCGPNQTCRPTATAGTDGEARDTIAFCYPDFIVPTSSTSTVVQPIEGTCRHAADCGVGQGCRFNVEATADHPTHPIGADFWGGRAALIGRCADTQPGPIACERGEECFSGLCGDGRCRVPCDPGAPEAACGRRLCLPASFERATVDGPVLDEVFVCERL